MQYKPNQRVAYYEVTGISDPNPTKNLEVGGILIDRPRGEITSWDFFNTETGRMGWVAGTRLGFARVDPETLTPIPEPDLQRVLDEKRAALESEAEQVDG